LQKPPFIGVRSLRRRLFLFRVRYAGYIAHAGAQRWSMILMRPSAGVLSSQHPIAAVRIKLIFAGVLELSARLVAHGAGPIFLNLADRMRPAEPRRDLRHRN
jgi:hypothetical protein